MTSSSTSSRRQPDPILQQLVEEVRRIFATDLCVVHLTEGDHCTVHAIAGDLPAPSPDLVQRSPHDPDLADRLAQAIAEAHPPAHTCGESCTEPVCQTCGSKACAAVPLQSAGGHQLGTLCLINREPLPFSETQVTLLQAFARAISGRVEHLAALAREQEARRHKAEQGRQLRQILERSSDLIVTIDSSSVIVSSNAATQTVLGYTPEEIIGRSVFTYMHPADIESSRAKGQLALHGKSIARHLMRCIRNDGRVAWLEWSVALLPGSQPLLQCVGRDVTDRYLANAQLAGKTRVLEMIVAGAPLAQVLNVLAQLVEAQAEVVSAQAQITIGMEQPPALATPAACHIPITAQDGQALGHVSLAYPSGEQVTPRDLHLCEFAAKLAAIALEQQHAVKALHEQERLYRLVTENSRDLIVLANPDATAAYISPSFYTALGYETSELMKLSMADLIHPDDLPHVVRDFQALVDGQPGQSAFRFRTRSGGYAWYEALAQPIRNAQGDVVQLQITCRDIGERRAFEEKLTHMAYHDSLTGLPNRARFIQRLEKALQHAQQMQEQLAVLFADLDNFKLINDSLGHQAGDDLLGEVCNRLLGCLRPSDLVARFGGDEFMILLTDGVDSAFAEAVAQRIARRLEPPVWAGGQEVFASFSIGIALSDADASRVTDLLRNADAAMYKAKEMGKAGYALFDPSMNDRALQRLGMESDLRRALERDELRVYFQPVVQLDTGLIAGMEALVRWEHPRRGLVPPVEFIPLAEETGLILPIGSWVLQEACRQAQIWQSQYPSDPPLFMAVNLSLRQFKNPRLVQEVADILAETGIPPSSLHLEITESLMMHDAQTALSILRRLKELGVHVAIDDFGTGYSSLSYLQRLPVDILKVDRSFVKGLGHDPDATAIVHTVITLAKTLGLTVHGEGIETDLHFTELRKLGCDRGQGYYHARPLSFAAASALLAMHPCWLAPPEE